MAAEFYRMVVRRRRSPLLRRRFPAFFWLGLARLQRLHPASHSRQRAAEMRLQLLQLFKRVGLCLADDLVGLRLRVLHDLRAVALCTPEDLVVGGCLLGALIRAGHDASCLGVRLADDALLL